VEYLAAMSVFKIKNVINKVVQLIVCWNNGPPGHLAMLLVEEELNPGTEEFWWRT